MSSASRSRVSVASRKGSDGFWQIGEKHGDSYASVLATRAAITARALVEPLIALLPPSSNSIQPSLKSSSIRMRGSGFLIPCERKSSAQDSRGTGTAPHRLSNDAGEGVGKVIRRYSAGPFQFNYARAGPVLTNEFGGQAPNIL